MTFHLGRCILCSVPSRNWITALATNQVYRGSNPRGTTRATSSNGQSAGLRNLRLRVRISRRPPDFMNHAREFRMISGVSPGGLRAGRWKAFKLTKPVVRHDTLRGEKLWYVYWIMFGLRDDGAVFWQCLSVPSDEDGNFDREAFWSKVEVCWWRFNKRHSTAHAPGSSFVPFKKVGVDLRSMRFKV